MPDATSTKAYRINIKNAKYCKLTSDTAAAAAYGIVIDLIGSMAFNVAITYANGTLYGDGKIKDYQDKIVKIVITAEMNKVDIERYSDLLGNTYENGVRVVKADDEAPWIAFGYQTEETEGKSEYDWMLKAKASVSSVKKQQQTTSINYSTDTLVITCIPRDFDNEIEYSADTANSAFTAAQAAKWFASGPVSPPVAA